MASNLFINLEHRNDTTALQKAEVSQIRRPFIMRDPERYECAIDRFSVHKAWLPVYEDYHTLTIKLYDIVNDETHTADLDFSAVVDSNNLLWDYNYFVAIFNITMSIACGQMTTTPITTDYPTLSIDISTWKATIDFTSATYDFKNDYIISFNEPLFSILNSFSFVSVVFEQSYFNLNTQGATGTTMTTADPVELSPVDTIYVKSSKMPLIYEYTPSATGTEVSDNTESIITDFQLGGQNRLPLNTINYSAISTGNYRFHSMEDGVFSTIDLAFFYKTYNGISHPLYILPSGFVNCKMFFKRL